MKLIVFSFLLVIFPLAGLAQYDVDDVKNDKESNNENKINPFKLKEKIYVGSGLNFLVGNTTFIYISPLVGYDLLPPLSVGLSTMFQYYKQGGSSLSRGIGFFTRYRPIDQLIIETSINAYSITFNGIPESKVKAKSWMLGLGYASALGEKSYYQAMIEYDLLKDVNVPEPALYQFNGGGRIYYKFGVIFYLSR